MPPSSNLAFDALEAKLVIDYHNLLQQLEQKYANRISELLKQKNKILKCLQRLFVCHKNSIKNAADCCAYSAKILAQNYQHRHANINIPVLGATQLQKTSPMKKMQKNEQTNINTEYGQISVNKEIKKPKLPTNNEKAEKVTTGSQKRRRRSRQRSFKCGKCNRRFCQKSGYNKHVQTHLSVKPFECSRCKKTFSNKQRMNGHRRHCYLFDKSEIVLAFVNMKLHKTKILDRKKTKNDDELYRIEYMDGKHTKSTWITSEQCLKCTPLNIEKQKKINKETEYVLNGDESGDSDIEMNDFCVLCPFPCEAKLDYVKASKCYNGSCTFCNYCEQEIDKNEMVFHCGKQNKIHPKGFDMCTKCAKRKAKFNASYSQKSAK